MPFRYDKALPLLKASGYTTYRIRKEKVMPESTLMRLRRNERVDTKVLETICRLCHCQPGDFMEYVPGDSDSEPET